MSNKDRVSAAPAETVGRREDHALIGRLRELPDSHWLLFVNCGFTIQEAKTLERDGLIDIEMQMGMPAARLRKNEGLTSEELREIDPINPGFIDAMDEFNRRDALALPTANREAIREALRSALKFVSDEVDNRKHLCTVESASDPGYTDYIKPAEDERDQITAALALIGEG